MDDRTEEVERSTGAYGGSVLESASFFFFFFRPHPHNIGIVTVEKRHDGLRQLVS